MTLTQEQEPKIDKAAAGFDHSSTAVHGLEAVIDKIESPEVQGEVNVWADYGLLGGEATQTIGVAPELPQPVVIESRVTGDDQELGEKPDWMVRMDEQDEKKVGIKDAKFDVSLDREGIANILRDNPELLPDRGYSDHADEERRADLQKTLDIISSLPENLDFKPGVTLLVGENGIGKSTLLRGLHLALKIKDAFDRSGQTDFEAFRDKLLDPSDFHRNLGGSSSESVPSMLSLEIARRVNVNQLESAAWHDYLDATVLNGLANEGQGIMSSGRVREDLSYGRSHGQLVREGLFGRLADAKKKYDERIEGKRSWGTVGPGVVTMDEPENGLSPRNHRKLKEKIAETTIDGSITLIATNSSELFFSPDIPRIDLEHPELGIHKPSDHPEIYDLTEFNA